MTDDQIIEFLRESNAIERVYDQRSLDDAVAAWKFLTMQKEMSKSVILMTHKILMKHQPIEDFYRGHFRQTAVYVGTREGAKWEDIPKEIDEWVVCMNAIDPHDWKRMHVWYETIHPFIDGNGRTGRMFMNWHRLQGKKPILIIHEGKEQIEYYKWFKEKV